MNYPTPQRIREIIVNVTRMGSILAVAGITVGTVAGYFGTRGYWFDTLANFRGLYFTFALLGAVLLVLTGGRKSAAFAAFVAGLNLWSVLPWTIPHISGPADAAATTPACGAGDEAKLLVINALISNKRHDLIIDYVRAEDPDILVMSELHWRLGQKLEAEFPYAQWRGPKYSYEVGVFSKFPIGEVERFAAGLSSEQFNGVISGPSGDFRLLAVHPPAPGNPDSQRVRNEALQMLAERASNSEIPVILAGDLNVTMWSPYYRPLEKAGLINARRGRAVAGTFPTALPPFRIPIDHVMHSSDFGLCEFEVGPSVNSDHLPLVARVALPPRIPAAIASR